MKFALRDSALSVVIMVVVLTGSAFAVPVVDGVFDLIEWDGYYVTDDGVGRYGYVGPGYGGQEFDVEYMGLRIVGNTVYFGLQTGFDLVNGSQGFAPGDFAIDVDGDQVYDYAINFSISGSAVTYTLYENPVWEDVVYSQHNISNPFRNVGGDIIDTFFFDTGYGSGIFPNNIDGGVSHVLEGFFDLSALDLHSGGDILLHWTMECGNDYLQVTGVVPEPTSLAMCGAGLLGLLIGRRRLRK
ncbi:MAG TPA: PEP-CTERM sorting domain-containing protein [Firmicutes bacterium]|nr:PEP-CTERM sorting domain-containing protein [Bacillota bacterium]